MIQFSVIVPIIGRPKFLAEALQSIRAQTHTNFECVVVDDASEQPVKLPFSDDRFQLIRREVNGGPAAARNTGMASAFGDAIAFLDDDDLFTPTRLEVASRLLVNADISLCGSGTVEQGQNSVNSKISRGISHDSVLDRTSPHLGTLTIRRECCPRFDESFAACEDLDWLIRATRDKQIISTSEIGWLWRQHQEPRVHHGSSARIRGSHLLLSKHADYFSTHRRARAFRYYRLARLSLAAGDQQAARADALRALKSGQLRALLLLVRLLGCDADWSK